MKSEIELIDEMINDQRKYLIFAECNLEFMENMEKKHGKTSDSQQFVMKAITDAEKIREFIKILLKKRKSAK